MAASFAKDQAAFNRSQGWKTLDDKWKARNQHIYDQIISSAGDDKSLTHDEYKNIFKNRGDAWGRYAYSRDSIAAALAEAGTSGGISLDSNARYMRDNDLAFDGNDILLRASGGWDEFDDDLRSSGKARYERGEEDGDDDYWNIYRFSGVPPVVDEEEDTDPDPVIPPVPCADNEIRNSDGVCEPVMSTLPGGDPTDTQEHADNQQEYIDFTYNIPQPDNSGAKRGWDDPDLKAAFLSDFMSSYNTHADGSYKYVTPGRQLGIDLTPAEQMGSIPYVSANQYMSNFINAPKLGTASSLASSLKDLDQLDKEKAARGGSFLS